MRAPTLAVIASCLALLSACSKPPGLEGKVTDLFGQPLSGATVVVQASGLRATSDAAGDFSLEVERGAKVNLKAGLDGYAPATVDVEVPAEAGAPVPKARFELWPDPQETGFYGKGLRELVLIKPARVVALGTDLREIRGVKDLLGSAFPNTTGPMRILFRSTLSNAEISQMDLRLFTLKFIEKTVIPGITGPQDVEADFWVADQEVSFDLRAMDARNLFLISTKEPVAKGMYVFQSQDILTGADPGSLDSVPGELRVVFPFEVR